MDQIFAILVISGIVLACGAAAAGLAYLAYRIAQNRRKTWESAWEFVKTSRYGANNERLDDERIKTVLTNTPDNLNRGFGFSRRRAEKLLREFDYHETECVNQDQCSTYGDRL